MGNVVKFRFSNALQRKSPWENVPLERLCWENYGIFFAEDKKFFSDVTIKMVYGLYDLHPRMSTKENIKEITSEKYIERMHYRQENIEEAILADIRLMSSEIFDEYFTLFTSKLKETIDFKGLKETLFLEEVEDICTRLGDDDGFGILDVAQMATEWASNITNLEVDDVLEMTSNNLREDPRPFVDIVLLEDVLYMNIKIAALKEG